MTKTIRLTLALTVALVALVGSTANASPATILNSNLVTNGDFEAGNVDFTSPLDYILPSNNDDQYYVITNPKAWYPQFNTFGDHTTGTGLMFAGNGSVEGGIAYISNTFDMVAGLSYDIGGWFTSLGCTTCVVAYGNSLLEMAVRVGQTDYVLASGATDNGAAGAWTWMGVSDWLAPASGTATVQIRTAKGEWSGNDFALDDVYARATATPVPEPASMILLGSGLVGIARAARRRANKATPCPRA